MDRETKYILMCKDDEILSFNVDFAQEKVVFIEELSRFDKAPYIFKQSNNNHHALQRFFDYRKISSNRSDLDDILKATGCKTSLELAFKGHNLSLSNHYWAKKENEKLKYEDINFFTNKWDDSFAKAVLSNNYEALANCDLNVPDVTTGGWGVKGWIYDNGPKLYKVGIDQSHPEEAIAEVLASRIARKIFNKNECLEYKLKKIFNRYASVCSPLVGVDEELIPLSVALPNEIQLIYSKRNTDRDAQTLLFKKLKENGLEDLSQHFVKLFCLKSLCFVSDLHFNNLSVIRNLSTGKLKVAPIYDLGGAFGSSKTGRQFLEKTDKSTLFVIYFAFGGLDPNWDYSWYHKEKLIGFEEEIRKYLSKSDFYKGDRLELAIEIFKQQKKDLDDLAEKK